MTNALEARFAGVVFEDGVDRNRRWRVSDAMLTRLSPRQETDIEAREIAARAAEAEDALGATFEAQLGRSETSWSCNR